MLKKAVNCILGDLFIECVANMHNAPETNKQQADKLLNEILEACNEFISRISHTEPGNVKGFYRKFHDDFNAKVSEIEEGIGKLHQA